MYRTQKKQNCINTHFLNLRPLVFSAIALATGVAFCYAALFHGVNLFFSLLSLIPCAVYLLFAKNKLRALLTFFLCLTFLGVGMGSFALRIQHFHNQPFIAGEYAVEGQICQITQGERYTQFLLEDITVDGQAASGKINATVYADCSQAKEGMVIGFTASLTPVGSAYRFHTFHADRVIQDVKYTATCSQSPTLVRQPFNPLSTLRESIRRALFYNLSHEQASLAYALTTGNTSYIEDGLLTSVRYGGVAHLFAVSGLHIGVVYGAILLLLKKLKLKKSVCLPVALTVAFLFCGVCAFSASSLRAFFICLATAICSAVGVRTDGIEGVGFACTLLLLINPANLLSVGFQLSVAAYASIVMLVPALRRPFLALLAKYPALNSPVNTFATLVSVQLGTLPILLNTFGYVSVWSIFLNPVLLPLFSLFFPVLLAAILLACIFPLAAQVLLFLPAQGLSLFASLFYALDFSTLLITGFFFGMVAVICYYLAVLLCSGRLNIKGPATAPLVCFLSATVLFGTAFNGKLIKDDCRITQNCYYDGAYCALVQSDGQNVLLVNAEINLPRVQTFLLRQGVSLNAVAVGNTDGFNNCINSLVPLSFERLYAPVGSVVELQTKEVVLCKDFCLGGTQYVFEENGAITFTFDGVKGVFGGTGENADFALFYLEERDGLIFTVNRGILSVVR